MTDNYEFLKNLNIDDIIEEEEADRPASHTSGEAAYQEDIPPAMAKQILGNRFIDKPDVHWQLIMERDITTLVAWEPDKVEPTEFVLESDDDVVSYEEMKTQVMNPEAYRMDAVEQNIKDTTPVNWTPIIVGAMLILLFAGFAIMAFLFSLT